MANLEPRWDLKADTDVVSEGQTTYIRIQMSKDDDNTNLEYLLTPTQHIEITFRITGEGDTLDERDFELSVGESMSSLVNIKSGSTGNTSIFGTHVVKLTNKEFILSNSTDIIDAYLLELLCVNDGTWDGPQRLIFDLDIVDVVTLEDEQIINQESSGVIGISEIYINYDNSNEVWVTPGVIARGEKYTIGELSYGADSRLFVNAYGQSRKFDDIIDTQYPDDNSNRVFIPTYELQFITSSEIPSENITTAGTVLNPKTNTITEEIDVVIQDTTGENVDCGLKFNGNGQFLQTLNYESSPIDAYFKAKIVPITNFYTTPEDAFYIGKRFKAYQMWVCPDDHSYIQGDVKPGHLYQLKNNTVYPYVIKSATDGSNNYAIFEENAWYDLGVYQPLLGDGIIGKERIFRILVNDEDAGGIEFKTDYDLGRIHVGEYFGHTVYPKIEASGTLVTYRIISETSPNDITKYGIDLSADGFMVGTAYAKSTDFSSNDDIILEFDVIANDISGVSITKRFKITIIRGFGQNFITAQICPSRIFERTWFDMIASENYSQDTTFYRMSDDRYGIQKLPRILLKENFVRQDYDFTTITNLKKTISEVLINPTSGAAVPDGIFRMVIGNYKITSALDNEGNVLYDLLYRELHPSGTRVNASISPHTYTIQENALFAEIFGLRQNIYTTVGEDITNLVNDPDDMENRGLVVKEIEGLSDQMIDTVPRFMNHPYTGDGLTAQFMPIIPVAYFQPGQADAFFNKLSQSNEHTLMVNTEFEVHAVEFIFHANEYERYVRDKFIIPIFGASL